MGDVEGSLIAAVGAPGAFTGVPGRREVMGIESILFSDISYEKPLQRRLTPIRHHRHATAASAPILDKLVFADFRARSTLARHGERWRLATSATLSRFRLESAGTQRAGINGFQRVSEEEGVAAKVCAISWDNRAGSAWQPNLGTTKI